MSATTNGRAALRAEADVPDNLGFEFTMAFQPIVDIARSEVYAYEALIRDAEGAPARKLLSLVTRHNRYRFDQLCRIKAIQLATELGLVTRLAINMLPNALRAPDTCLASTLAAAERFGLPRERLIFELTERERIRRPAHLGALRSSYREHGFATAIDDFGAGYAGLQLLADFQPDMIKLDLRLVHGIAHDRTRQAIVRGMVEVATSLDCKIVAEGVENEADLETLRKHGITLFQGFLFAHPAIGRLPEVAWHRWS